MGFGKKYVDECQLCAEMIDAWDKDRPKALLTSPEDYEYARSKEIFEDIIVLDYNKEARLVEEKNAHNLYCVIPRVLMSDIIPYEKTLAIDSDIACISHPNMLWAYIEENNQPFTCCGFESPEAASQLGYPYESWHWGGVSEINKKAGGNIPAIHGGVLCFNKGHPNYPQFRADCFDVLDNYDDYGCTRQFRGGMTDEPIFAIAMLKNNISPLNYVTHPTVSFNLPFGIDLPCFYHTINGVDRASWKKCAHPIIFNHIFFHEGNNQTYYEWFLNFHQQITRQTNQGLNHGN